MDDAGRITRVEEADSAAGGESEIGTLAGVVHLLYFAQTIGIIIAVVLWAIRGKRSRFLAFQCAQAVVLQGGVLLIMMVMAFGFFFVAMLSFWAAEVTTRSADPNPWPFWIGFPLFWIGMMVFWLIYLALGGVSIWAAVRCFQGRDPWIPGIATIAARLTGHTRTS